LAALRDEKSDEEDGGEAKTDSGGDGDEDAKERTIALIVSMGFSRAMAEAAFARRGGDLARAVEFLLTNPSAADAAAAPSSARGAPPPPPPPLPPSTSTRVSFFRGGSGGSSPASRAAAPTAGSSPRAPSMSSVAAAAAAAGAARMSASSSATSMASSGGAQQRAAAPQRLRMPPLAAPWRHAVAPDGRVYFLNDTLRTTQWTHPVNGLRYTAATM
jgi:hypothetical protein